MRRIVTGIVAHVDAGKTTFIESMLLNAGVIKKAGRVDKGDAFLDTDSMEKDRGITIFSKQAIFTVEDLEVILMDTPGHVDFSAEMERTLRVLDIAILIISATDGIQSHTRTLWRLLEEYKIPVILFVNKMDQPDTDKEKILSDLETGFKCNFIDWNGKCISDMDEAICMSDEAAMEQFLDTGKLDDDLRKQLFTNRLYFPVLFGSALKNEGVDKMSGILEYFGDLQERALKREKNNKSEVNIFCYKISHDDKGEKISHLRITSGSIAVKDTIGTEKIHGIRVYNGAKYISVDEAHEGMICAVTGPVGFEAGMIITIGVNGEVKMDASAAPLLSPVLSYRLVFQNNNSNFDMTTALKKLRLLAEEDPDIALEYEEESGQINIRLMGEIQTEIIARRIKERFGYDVTFGESRIIYKETIRGGVVEGVGHFEPLRHYAEVHLLLEPGLPGSGIVAERNCSEDILDLNWQRLILTHINERIHRGVLTGSPLTDVKITVVTGKAHTKHTEGGDFRQATYRAIRNGLMQAESVLLEPYYDFMLYIPSQYVGRAMTDLERMHAVDFIPETEGEYTVLKGKAPAACIQGYGKEVLSYTSGLGNLSLTLSGYGECHNSEEIILARGYDPERDIRNTADSVFCEHGTGVIIPWNRVKEYMHMPSALNPVKELTDEQIRQRAKREYSTNTEKGYLGVEEIDAILDAATNANKNKAFVPHKGINRPNSGHQSSRGTMANGNNREIADGNKEYVYKPVARKTEFLLVDGYNVIFAWKELNALASKNIDSARDKLIDILCAYQPIRGCEIIAVFDAYRVVNHREEWTDHNNIHVVFTKTAETADRYIERFVRDEKNKKEYRTTVVTSDGMEQIIVRGAGASLISSREFEQVIKLDTENYNARFGIIKD